MQLEILRHIHYQTSMTAWLNMSPKKGQESLWKKQEPKLFSPDFLGENKAKEAQAMDIEELKDHLARKRV